MGRFDDITFDSIKQIAETPAKEINRRRINLWFHRFLYYKFDTSIISDFEYDKKEVEYKILREHYSKIKIRESCPLYCVGTDCDDATESKVMGLIDYWTHNHKDEPKNEPQNVACAELKTDLRGNLLLFGTQFVRCS